MKKHLELRALGKSLLGVALAHVLGIVFVLIAGLGGGLLSQEALTWPPAARWALWISSLVVLIVILVSYHSTKHKKQRATLFIASVMLATAWVFGFVVATNPSLLD